MTSRVSVILPTFNRAGLIGETLKSLLAQRRPVDEILVIDDGSTDATGEVVAGFGAPVRYLRKQNGGKAHALNLGLQASTGDLVWICDDDDLLLPQACARLAGALDADPRLDFCAGRHEDFTIDPRSGEMQIKPPGYWRASAPDEIFPDLLDGCHIFQPGLIVRRTAYERAGPFDADLTRSQDYEMLLRIARRGNGRLLPETVFLHREHPGARGSARDRFAADQSNTRWIAFHRRIFEPLLAELDDEEVLPASVWSDPARRQTRVRTAALKRASVYARHQLWPEAVAAWQAANERFEGPLDEVERSIVKSATLHSFGCAPLYQDREIRTAMLELKGRGALGREIVRLVAQSLQWRIRQAIHTGAPAQAMRLTGLVTQMRL